MLFNAFETDTVQSVDDCQSCEDSTWLQRADLPCISLVLRVTTDYADVEARRSGHR